ncbi:MAG: hypothetical protein COB67_07895 [SAR324 cluster bacterium]|uniref:Hydrogenase iron-sulfur subunit n=1 Tax=SAR324 cluster bacterium TaxID=2024889 RepID=A0A2A4T290_9DELT|nr:MAG: hypothetical protein COB67_07895 [SAR324 cluster bacterium]
MKPDQQPKNESLIARIHRLIRWFFYQFEVPFNQLVSERYNPFYYLGALTVFTLMLLTGTGLYLFIYYSPTADNVFESIRYVNDEVFLGSLLRSIHHYGSDLLIILMILHMMRTFAHEKYRGYRWVAWVSGVMLLVFTLIEGVTGYIMIWNSRSQFIAINSSKLLASLKVLGDDIPRAFSSIELMSYWIMWILLAIHILIPIAMLGVLFMHVSRMTRPKLMPPRPLIFGTLGILIVISALFPVPLFEKANFMEMAQVEHVDWFYLFLTPIIEDTPPSIIWLGFVGLTMLLMGVPWYRGKLKVDTAIVNLDNCTGCTACSKDCPYDAINMQDRTDGRRYKKEPFINSSKCAGCGICIGSCDHLGMDLHELKVVDIEAQAQEYLKQTDSSGYLGIFCGHSVLNPIIFNPQDKSLRSESRMGVISLPCAGVVGKALIQKLYEMGAKGVVVAACRINDCHYREGNQWLHDRLDNTRVPKMRLEKDSKPFLALSFSQTEAKDSIEQITAFIDQSQKKTSFKPTQWFQSLSSGNKAIQAIKLTVAATVLAAIFGFGAIDPDKHTYGTIEGHGMLRVSYFYKSHRASCGEMEQVAKSVATSKDNKKMTFDEISKQRNEEFKKRVLRKGCPRTRQNSFVSILIDGEQVLKKKFIPAGFGNDGLTYINLQYVLPVGTHRVTLLMSEDEAGTLYPQKHEQTFQFKEKQILFIDYKQNQAQFFNRK